MNTHNDDYVYDKIKKKEDNNIRLLYLNINGLPKESQHPKNNNIFNSTKLHEADILGLSETNLNWNLLPQRDHWRERTTGIWESSHSNLAYNTKDITSISSFQPGGNLIHSVGKCCHRVISSDRDPSGLGRWCSTKYKGINNIRLRVVCAYRPCKQSTPGPSTTYSQHLRYYNEHDDDRCPRQAFLDDLLDQLDTWRNEGDQLVLMLDCNEDTRSNRISNALCSIGLKNAILHNRSDTSYPTYHRGSQPIDGIFTSSTISLLQGGYLPFGEFPSDHRALWMDIHHDNAFGYRMTETISPLARRLKCDLPKVRLKFNHDYKTFLRKHHLEERLYNLQQRLTSPIHEEDAKEYESILNIRNTAIDYADKRCRKVYMGATPFSPELKTSSKLLELWKAVHTKKTGARYSMNKLRRLERQTGSSNTLSLPLHDVKIKLKEAQQNFWKTKKKSNDLRQSFLLSKAEDIANHSNVSPENVYFQLLQREKLRRAHKRIRTTTGKSRSNAITKVDTVSSDGQVVELTTKKDIETACIQENELKYRQTENTPFMDGIMNQELGYLGMTEASFSITNGTFICPDDAPPYTQEFLSQFQLNEHTSTPPPTYMTTESYVNGWKKMKEKTSAASITGIHFGHLKSCALDPTLADFEAAISNVPYATGYQPKQWQNSIICMIKKKSNVDLVTKLRSIVLTEADFNFNNKKLGRESIHHAESNHLLAREQYGSRQGKRAIDHALNKRLLYDVMRQSRKPGALCSNDAKSCYDRVLHSITMLAFRRLGLSTPPVECMLRCIQQMKHYIRTSFGDSETYLSSKDHMIPFQGILQGNGAAPTIWVIISTPLLNMLREANNGAHTLSPLSQEQDHIVGFAFVDDTDLVSFHQDRVSLTDDVMIDMQDSIDRWEGGLKLTGGAIVPEKSWVYPIDFEFAASGKWSYQQADTINYNFTVQDHEGIRQPLAKLNPDQGMETLGVILAPDGNNDLEIKKLTDKSTSWSDYILAGHLDTSEARLALDTTIMRTLAYPLPALNLTESECNKIMSPVLTASLAKTRVSRNFPKAVIYGPKSEKGLGFHNLFLQQGTSHLGIIQQHLESDSITGSFLRNSIELLKVELGIGSNIFHLHFDVYGHLATDCWIKSVWEFTSAHEIRINESVTDDVILRRTNDAFIMDSIIDLSYYSKSELQHINRCRLYLQVTTLSDITTSCGRQFAHSAYHCKFDSSIPHYYNWPLQPRPYGYARMLWKQAIKKAFPRTGHILRQALGPWTDNARDSWIWFHQPSTGRLFRRSNGRLKMYMRTSRAGSIGRQPRFRYCTQAISLPPNARRATIRRIDRRTVKLTGTTRTLQELDDTTPRIQRELLHNSRLRESMQESYFEHNITRQEVRQMMQGGNLKLVSDGSYLNTLLLGTAAWTIATSRHKYLSGSHFTPGPGEIQCSHRSELSGILGAILHANDLCSEFDVTSGSADLRCDGQGAVDIVSYLNPSINPSRKHFDLLHSISRAISNSPLQWTFKHVRGHQDECTDINDLSDWEFWNTIADTEAKAKLTQISQLPHWTSYRPPYPPLSNVTISHLDSRGNNVLVCSQLARTCMNSIATMRIRDYWKRKNFFPNNTAPYIDWSVSQKSSLSLPLSRQVWLSKWTAGICGVGKWLQRWKWQEHSNCPRCGQCDEDTAHVLLCQEVSALNVWNDTINNLDKWLCDNMCEPDMRKTIVLSLQSWHDGTRLPSIQSNNPLLTEAINQQDRLTWYSLLCGFLARGWREVQRDYFVHQRSTKSDLLWMSKLQKRIWEIPWTMWEHRNNHLHNGNLSIHMTDNQNIVLEIMREWEVGLGDLPPQYLHLFQGTVHQRLNVKIDLRLKWLASVWAARDRISRKNQTPTDPERNQIAFGFFQRWRNMGH